MHEEIGGLFKYHLLLALYMYIHIPYITRRNLWARKVYSTRLKRRENGVRVMIAMQLITNVS